jgi:hypothetical protein
MLSQRIARTEGSSDRHDGSPEPVCEQATDHAIAALLDALRHASTPSRDR